MPIIVKSPRAKADLTEIWDYIADDSESRADAFIDTIDRKLKILAEQPSMGRMREELADGFMVHILPLVLLGTRINKAEP
jgi:toxin ParE1/3/4